MSSPVPTPPPPPPSPSPSPSPPKSQKLLGNFDLSSDPKWSTKKQRTKSPPRMRRIPNPNDLHFLHENPSKPSSDYSSRGLSPKRDVHNAAHGSSSRLKIGSSGSPAGVTSSFHPKPRSTSSKVQESKDKNVKVDREVKQSSQEKKKKGKAGDEKERKNEKKMKEKEPNQEPRAKRENKLPTFSRQLSFEDIAADFETMTGNLPPRKPKKRPDSVQRQVDRVTPGLWLGYINRNRYKVGKETKKSKQGREFEEHHSESESE